MGLREFRDRDGVLWQVWSVTSEVLDKRTTAEDYMRDWADGWLCFEHPGGRRRLAQFPPDWEQLPDASLEALLQQAQHVKARRSGSVSGEFPSLGQQSLPAAPPVVEREVEQVSPDGRADSGSEQDAPRRRQTDVRESDQHTNPPL